jgi:hypothetical protein
VTPAGPPEHRPVLQSWPELGGFDPPPPSLEAAREAFSRGAEAYARGADTEARGEFLRAAKLIPEAASSEYGASLERLRSIAVANAAIIGSDASGY